MKKKDFIAFNIFWCSPFFLIPFLFLSVNKVEFYPTLIISFYFYLSNLYSEVSNDFHEARIKKLEDENARNTPQRPNN